MQSIKLHFTDGKPHEARGQGLAWGHTASGVSSIAQQHSSWLLGPSWENKEMEAEAYCLNTIAQPTSVHHSRLHFIDRKTEAQRSQVKDGSM